MFRAGSRKGMIALAAAAAIAAACGTTSRISIFDRFRESSDDAITDIVTGLQWRIGPDRDFDWHSANIWIANLEGDWRMPTLDELEDLFDAGITTETWGPFDNTGWLVWCVDYASRNMAYRFCFIPRCIKRQADKELEVVAMGPVRRQAESPTGTVQCFRSASEIGQRRAAQRP